MEELHPLSEFSTPPPSPTDGHKFQTTYKFLTEMANFYWHCNQLPKSLRDSIKKAFPEEAAKIIFVYVQLFAFADRCRAKDRPKMRALFNRQIMITLTQKMLRLCPNCADIIPTISLKEIL
jgi:hypothetical protein